MRNTVKLTPMRGFTCPVGRIENGTTGIPAGGVALGVDRTEGEITFVLAMRHADGTVLAASLGEGLTDRFAHLFADLLTGDSAASGIVWLQ